MAAPEGEGLRARKKREQRQRISDTATAMFLERGFDRVTVAEVARECDVSEKTVYNYFPAKELLVLDRLEDDEARLRAALADGTRPVGLAVAEAIAEEIAELMADDELVTVGRDVGRRFLAMIEATPSLRMTHQDATERLVAIAAEILAARVGVDPGDPEPQMAAIAVVGLYRLGQRSWVRTGTGPATGAEVAAAIAADLRRGADLLDAGLSSWAPPGGRSGASARRPRGPT